MVPWSNTLHVGLRTSAVPRSNGQRNLDNDHGLQVHNSEPRVETVQAPDYSDASTGSGVEGDPAEHSRGPVAVRRRERDQIRGLLAPGVQAPFVRRGARGHRVRNGQRRGRG